MRGTTVLKSVLMNIFCFSRSHKLVCLYIDDLIFTGNDEALLSFFKESMMKTFDMTDLGRMRYFHYPCSTIKLTRCNDPKFST